MSFLTKPAVTKGEPSSFTLVKSQLILIPKVSSDAFFADTTNWQRVTVQYVNTHGQEEALVFDASLENPIATFSVTEKARSDYQITRIIVRDIDDGIFVIARSDLSTEFLAELDVSFTTQFLWITPTKLADPATLPVGTGHACSWSPNREFLAVAHLSYPYITIYQRSGTTFTKLANPATLPTNVGLGCSWSPNGEFLAVVLAVAHELSPIIIVYQRSGTTFTKLANPATLPTSTADGAGYGCSWSPNGEFLAVAHDPSPFLTIYQLNGTTLTKIADPSTLPTGTGLGCSWTPNGEFLAVSHDVYPYLTVYQRSGTTFTKLANPAIPAGIGLSCEWSPDGEFLAVAYLITPFLTIYQRSGTTLTKLANPATLPSGQGNGCSWSPEGEFLVVAHASSPFITVYQRSGVTFTKLTDPAILPSGLARDCSWSSNGEFLAVAHATTPFLSIYQTTNAENLEGLGVFQLGTEYLPSTDKVIFESFEDGMVLKQFGWSGLETTSGNLFRWTSGFYSRIIFNTEFNNIGESGEISLRFFTLGSQQISLKLNGNVIYSQNHSVGHNSPITIVVRFQTSYLVSGFNILEFNLPNAYQPSPNDIRLLALGLVSFEVSILTGHLLVTDFLGHWKADTLTLNNDSVVTSWNSETNSTKLGFNAPIVSIQGSPKFYTNVINNKPVVHFHKHFSDLFSGYNASHSGLFTGLNIPAYADYTIITVYDAVVQPSGQNVATRAISGSNNWLFGERGTGNKHSLYTGNFIYNELPPFEGSVIASAVSNKSQNFVKGYFMGKLKATDINNLNSSPANIIMGNHSAGFSNAEHAGFVAELLVYDRALSDSELHQVHQYLSIKYNLPLAV